jgi:hypothetical protein
MPIYLFASSSNPSVLGFTSDSAGGNLPQELAPWKSAGAPVPIGSNMDFVARAVADQGFCIIKEAPARNATQ